MDNISNNDNNINTKDILWIPKKKIALLNKDSKDIKNIENENGNNSIGKMTKEYIQLKIKEKIFLKKPFKEKKKLGRKIKSDECLGEHNKFSDDNILRKLRKAILNCVLKFINEKLKTLYSTENKLLLNEMKILKLKQNSIEKEKANYNKKLLNKTLKSIFSDNISSKYSRYLPNHNKKLIEKIIKWKRRIKKKYI